MDLSPGAIKRNEMVEQSMTRLQHFAFRALSVHGMRNDQFIIVCILVDTEWRELVDMLMPNVPEEHWQSLREAGTPPVARGLANSDACEYILERHPALRAGLEEVYPEGTARCIALDDTGGTVYQIEAKEDLSTRH
jgi:hypothetical protein